MDWSAFFLSLLSIVVIDLFLAGDNAIVIGMVAGNLPDRQQKSVILWGTLAAIAVRSLTTLLVVWLLEIPFLRVVGGLILIWIAYSLLVAQKRTGEVKTAKSLLGAIQTIVVADLVMGLDNVLAVAGAARGSFLLVVLGLLISVPIMIWCSTLILYWIDRHPWLIYIGSGIIAWTAARMIADEPFFVNFFATASPLLRWAFELAVVATVVALGWHRQGRLQSLP